MKRIKEWIILSIISFLLSSATILFIPLVSYELEKKRIFACILAVVFLLGIAIGFMFLRMADVWRKKVTYYSDTKCISFFRFFSNTPAIVFDILLFISLNVFGPVITIRVFPQWLTVTSSFMFLFSLEMHGVFNSKTYNYLSESHCIPFDRAGFSSDRSGNERVGSDRA